jgi:hypothetical protein
MRSYLLKNKIVHITLGTFYSKGISSALVDLLVLFFCSVNKTLNVPFPTVKRAYLLDSTFHNVLQFQTNEIVRLESSQVFALLTTNMD